MDKNVRKRIHMMICVFEWIHYTSKYHRGFAEICGVSCQVPTKEQIPRAVVTVPRRRYHGFNCMLLAHGESLSQPLQNWVFRLEAAGVYCCVANSWQECRNQVFSYLGMSLDEPSLNQKPIESVIVNYEKKLAQESDSKFIKLASLFFSAKKAAANDLLRKSTLLSESRHITCEPKHFKLPDEREDPKLVAVMMPFDAIFNSTYKNIKESVERLGSEFRCKRADEIWDSSTIPQDIFSLIYRARVVVVDFSGKNPNVMYETGIAHTLGREVVPITQSIEDIPSDIIHHKAMVYLPNEEGYRDFKGKFTERLRLLLGV